MWPHRSRAPLDSPNTLASMRVEVAEHLGCRLEVAEPLANGALHLHHVDASRQRRLQIGDQSKHHLEFVENQLDVGVDGTKLFTESGVVMVYDLVRLQDSALNTNLLRHR